MATSKGIIIDPTKNTRFPVMLSDALLGKASRDTFMGVRYNHRPSLSSDLAPAKAHLKKSAKACEGLGQKFVLGFDDNGDRYQFNGVRTSEGTGVPENDGHNSSRNDLIKNSKDGGAANSSNRNNFILVFDPSRKCFVLHRLDSMFHMNVTKTPASSDAECLRREFPHLEVNVTRQKTIAPVAASKKNNSNTPKQASAGGKEWDPSASKAKSTKQQQPQDAHNATHAAAGSKQNLSTSLTCTSSQQSSFPKSNSKRRRPSRASSMSESSDDEGDDPLIIENPATDFTPRFKQNAAVVAPHISRRFSEYLRDREEEDDDNHPHNKNKHKDSLEEGDEDADGEEDEVEEHDDEDEEFDEFLVHDSDGLDSLKLPSPSVHRGAADTGVVGGWGDDDDADADLEAELERELNGGEMVDEAESEVSEED